MISMGFRVEVFSVVLQGKPGEKLASVHFWVAADPVTTVEAREPCVRGVSSSDLLNKKSYRCLEPI